MSRIHTMELSSTSEVNRCNTLLSQIKYMHNSSYFEDILKDFEDIKTLSNEARKNSPIQPGCGFRLHLGLTRRNDTNCQGEAESRV